MTRLDGELRSPDDRARQTDDPADRWRRLLRLLEPDHDRLRRTARRLARSSADGDDLFQETVLRSFRKLDDLREEDRFAGWFYTVLLSVHRSRARRDFWRRFLPLDVERERGFDPPAPAGGTEEERRRAERASRALATLPAVQREAVVLFELEGFSIEEIAALQQVSIPAVKSRLQRGRARLRRHYERILGPAERPAPAGGAPVEPGLAGAERTLKSGGTP